jgi:hypothetical protein
MTLLANRPYLESALPTLVEGVAVASERPTEYPSLVTEIRPVATATQRLRMNRLLLVESARDRFRGIRLVAPPRTCRTRAIARLSKRQVLPTS